MSSAADGKEMSFWDHLDELRGTIIRSVAAVCIFAILAFLFKDAIFAFVLAPCKPGFFLYELLKWNLKLDLINIELSAQFMVHLKQAILVEDIVKYHKLFQKNLLFRELILTK